jgi:hypothetical protein
MKTVIQTKTAGKIEINSEFLGNKPAKWDTKAGTSTNYNNHKVTIKHNGKRLSFDFWGSIMNPEIANDQENVFALYCFLSDAVSGKQSFEDFCSEFGYDEDSRSVERIRKECEKSLKKFEKVFEADIYDLINEIQETHNC